MRQSDVGIEELSDFDLPEGWEIAKLGFIAESLTYGYTASAKEGSKGPRFLRITDIQNGAVDWDKVPTCEIGVEDIRKYGLCPGDIVFARTGATTGKSFLIERCPPAVFASYLIRLRICEGLLPNLLSYYLQTSEYWNFISENVAGIAQPNCNASKLAELPVPIPPVDEQKRMIAAISRCLSKVATARTHITRASAILKDSGQHQVAVASLRVDQLTQSLLARAFDGALVVTEAELARSEKREYEPASVLLERIKLMKAKPLLPKAKQL